MGEDPSQDRVQKRYARPTEVESVTGSSPPRNGGYRNITRSSAGKKGGARRASADRVWTTLQRQNGKGEEQTLSTGSAVKGKSNAMKKKPFRTKKRRRTESQRDEAMGSSDERGLALIPFHEGYRKQLGLDEEGES